MAAPNTVDRKLTCRDKTSARRVCRMRSMNTERKTQRGRPPLGRARMVTIGIRMEPQEREQLELLAAEQGASLCGYLRDIIRRELAQQQADQVPLRACN